MPSFDVVSRLDMQEVDNAVNNTRKELMTRFDFRNVPTEITFDRKEKVIKVVTADKMKMEAIREILLQKAAKRNLDLRSFEFADPTPTAHGALKRDIKLKEGIEREIAQKIVKQIKDMKLKVQGSIQGDEVRVSGKSIDDLQTVIASLKAENFGVPLQFVNMQK